MPSTLDHQAQLRAAGLRTTKQRLAVLNVVSHQPHADTATILDGVRRDLPTVSHQTVYDALHDLTAAGLLRRFQPQGSVALYETRTADNHHHLACRSCGSVVDVDCAIHQTPCLTPSDDQGFIVDEAEVIYWGLCPRCAAAPTDDQ
ncbi:MAG TPA: Fur family transcriptional regulator [Marmoricola sp.]|nr:Fur family transcriptional regulator [Marmoricola sp.]